MADVFDQFRKSEEEEQTTSHTSEEHLYRIIKPGNEKELSLLYVVQDRVDDKGQYTLHRSHTIAECGCCGALTAFSSSPDIRIKPPAARCQDPDCRELICQKCADRYEERSCVVCGKAICPKCMRRPYKVRDMVFCKDCFQEHDEKNRQGINACLTKE